MMKRTNLNKLFTCITCIVLIAAMALFTCGCTKGPSKDGNVENPKPGTSQTQGGDTQSGQLDGKLEDGKTYGQGKTEFPLTVVHADGSEVSVTIRTDKTIVGEALQELGILAGEEGPYGLYVKTVDGETLDYDTHGMYWSFYQGGNYAMTGVDQTAIEPGVSYAIKAEKA